MCLDLPHRRGNDKEGVIKDWQKLNYLAPSTSAFLSWVCKHAHIHTHGLLAFLLFLFSCFFLCIFFSIFSLSSFKNFPDLFRGKGRVSGIR